MSEDAWEEFRADVELLLNECGVPSVDVENRPLSIRDRTILAAKILKTRTQQVEAQQQQAYAIGRYLDEMEVPRTRGISVSVVSHVLSVEERLEWLTRQHAMLSYHTQRLSRLLGGGDPEEC